MLHSSAGKICYALHSVHREELGWHVQSYACEMSPTIRNGHVQLMFSEDSSRASANPKDVIMCPQHVRNEDLRRAEPEEFERELRHARSFRYPVEPLFKVQPQNRNNPPMLFWHSKPRDGPYIVLRDRGDPVMLSLRNNERLLSPRDELRHLLVHSPQRSDIPCDRPCSPVHKHHHVPPPQPENRITSNAKRRVPGKSPTSPDAKRMRFSSVHTGLGVFDVDTDTLSRGVARHGNADGTWPSHLRSKYKLEVRMMTPQLAVQLFRNRFVLARKGDKDGARPNHSQQALHMSEDNRCFLHMGVVCVRTIAAEAARAAAAAHAEVSQQIAHVCAVVSRTIAASASASAAQAATNASAAVHKCLKVYARIVKLQSAICDVILQE